jgi:hypothetical protein
VGAEGALEWIAFECDGRRLEYLVVHAEQEITPPNGGSGPVRPVVMVCVRKLGSKDGPAMMYPQGTVATVAHACDTARLFTDQLA